MQETEVFVVPFFLNGELEDVRTYSSFENASADAAKWAGYAAEVDDAQLNVSPFRCSGVWCVKMEREVVWPNTASGTGTPRDTIVAWLRRTGAIVWSNVIAHVMGQSLDDVYHVLEETRDLGLLEIVDTVDTSVGRIALVRPT